MKNLNVLSKSIFKLLTVLCLGFYLTHISYEGRRVKKDICVKDTIHIKELIPYTKENKFVRDSVINFFVKNEILKRASFFYHKDGILPSVYLSHAALESGFGTSKLIKKTKNRGNIKSKFGIKAYDKIEKSNDKYKVFPTYYEGEKAVVKLLLKYKHIRKVKGSVNFKEWTKALEDSPYSTDDKYSEKLNSIIKKWSLYNIDHAIIRGDVIINYSNDVVCE